MKTSFFIHIYILGVLSLLHHQSLDQGLVSNRDSINLCWNSILIPGSMDALFLNSFFFFFFGIMRLADKAKRQITNILSMGFLDHFIIFIKCVYIYLYHIDDQPWCISLGENLQQKWIFLISGSFQSVHSWIPSPYSLSPTLCTISDYPKKLFIALPPSFK